MTTIHKSNKMKFIFSKTALFVLFFSFLFIQETNAQTGAIAGNLLEKQQAVEFASVSLARMPDSTKVIFSTTTDSVGSFSFNKLAFGQYLLKISLLSYQTISRQIEVSEQSSSVNLKNVAFESDSKMLGEVSVTAQKKLIQKTNEGFILNAAANITQAGGTAADLLRNTPTVAVDADGGITLRGKSPLILINGRNSNLANIDQIAASSIESIEIINSASAKYDANAESGIINIILKKNKSDGTNGALVLGVGEGSRFRVNSSAILNHKAGRWNVGLGYDNRFAGRTKSIVGSRTNFTLPNTYLLNQNRTDERYERLQNLKLNIDYQIDKQSGLSFEAIGNMNGQDNDETLLSRIFKQNNAFSTGNTRHSVELQGAEVAEFALEYGKKFDKDGQSLTASVSSSIENGRENTAIDSKSVFENASAFGDATLQRTHNYENGVISNAKLDYSVPVSKNGSLEVGYKGTFRTIKSDFETADGLDGIYKINTAASNIFNFNENVHALYALYQAKTDAKKWNYEAGLRAEKTENGGQLQDNLVNFTNNYLNLFPTAKLVYNVSEDQFWKLSYGKRINRPRLGQLSPFVDITDALNPHSGNPNLKPEIIHALELGYSKENKHFGYSSNVFYRYSINTIRQFFQPMGSGVVLNKPVNIGSAMSYGLENVITGKPSSFYDFNISATFFQQKLNASNIQADVVQNAFNWFGKVINNFAIGKNGKLQLVGNYTSAAVTPQGTQIPVYFADLGFQQKLGKGNARLGLTVTDIFNSLKSGYENVTTDFSSSRISKADTRAIMLTFAFSFKTTVKEKMMENGFSREW